MTMIESTNNKKWFPRCKSYDSLASISYSKTFMMLQKKIFVQHNLSRVTLYNVAKQVLLSMVLAQSDLSKT